MITFAYRKGIRTNSQLRTKKKGMLMLQVRQLSGWGDTYPLEVPMGDIERMKVF